MALSIPQNQPQSFERHIRRLVWCALIATLTLLGLALQATQQLNSRQLSIGLAAAVLLVAAWTVLNDVHAHARREQMWRRDATAAGRQEGACQAAEAIQSRVANALSVTVGYAEFLAEDARLPTDAREHARKAMASAFTATSTISQFKETLRCVGDSGPR